MSIADETLMAYADGELAPDQAALIRDFALRDPAVAARIEMFRQTRNAVAGAFATGSASETRQDDSDPMIALIRKLDKAPQQTAAMAGNVVTFPPRRTVPLWQLPAAAAIALAVGLSAALLRSGPAEQDIAHLTILPENSLAQALDTLPSGARQTVETGGIEIIGSFTTADGAFCREFELDAADGRTAVSVACRGEAAWDLHFVVIASSGEDGYAPASSLESLDAWLAAIDASAPMSAEDEAAALLSIN